MTHCPINSSSEDNNAGGSCCTMPRLKNIAHWFPRIGIASVFVYHGIDKLPKIDMVAQMLDLPPIVISLVAAFEIIGGLMILLAPLISNNCAKDMMTKMGAMILIPIIVTAIAMVHWGQWHFMPSESHMMGGMEFQFTLLMTLIFLFIRGKDA